MWKLEQHARLLFGLTNGESFFQKTVHNLTENYKVSGTYAYLDNITECGSDKADHDAKLKALFSAEK